VSGELALKGSTGPVVRKTMSWLTNPVACHVCVGSNMFRVWSEVKHENSKSSLNEKAEILTQAITEF